MLTVFEKRSIPVHSIGQKGSWRWIISNFSSASIVFIGEDNLIEMVTRAMEPLLGIGRGLPKGINRSPKVEITLDAGAIILTWWPILVS